MEQSFYDQLATDGIPQELIDYMAEGWTRSLPDLPAYCDKISDISKFLVDKIAATEGQRKYRVPLAHLWEAAVAMRDTTRKRKLEGVTETEMEVNVDPEVARTLKIQYAKDYGYTLQRHEVLWSHLLGRASARKST